MRIAVMGPGALGGFFGGLLARAGEDVTLIARGETLHAIQANGLTVKSGTIGNFTVYPAVTEHPGALAPVDLVLFCVKTYDLESAAQQLLPIVERDTIILTVQNGIDAADRITRVLGPGHVMNGVSYVVTGREAPGIVFHKPFPGKLLFGEVDRESSHRVEELDGLFQRAEISAEPISDILLKLWEKFVVVCATNGVCALTRLPFGPIMASTETSKLFRGTMLEAAALARAKGIEISAERVDQFYQMLAASDPKLQGSMCDDVIRGGRLELEAMSGTVVRLGREMGIPTPLNFVVYAALLPFVDGEPANA